MREEEEEKQKKIIKIKQYIKSLAKKGWNVNEMEKFFINKYIDFFKKRSILFSFDFNDDDFFTMFVVAFALLGILVLFVKIFVINGYRLEDFNESPIIIVAAVVLGGGIAGAIFSLILIPILYLIRWIYSIVYLNVYLNIIFDSRLNQFREDLLKGAISFDEDDIDFNNSIPSEAKRICGILLLKSLFCDFEKEDLSDVLEEYHIEVTERGNGANDADNKGGNNLGE